MQHAALAWVIVKLATDTLLLPTTKLAPHATAAHVAFAAYNCRRSTYMHDSARLQQKQATYAAAAFSTT